MNRTLSRYFDEMARIIRRILDGGQFSDKEFSSVYCDENSYERMVLRQNFPMLIEVTRDAVKSIGGRVLNHIFFAKVNQAIEEENTYFLMLLLYYMDGAIINFYQQIIGFEDEIETMKSLNGNLRANHIAVLRKAKCNWDHRNIGSGLNGILLNFYFIDYRELEGIVVENHIVDSRLLFMEQKDSIKFALSPVTKEKVDCFSKPYKGKNTKTGASQMFFRAEGLENERMVSKQVLENIYEAGKNKASVLVFPEMLGSRKMLTDVIEDMKGKRDIPEIIVFPSIWEKTKDDLQNSNKSALIWKGEEVLFEQCKHCNYSYHIDDKPVYEDINRKTNQNNIVHLLHMAGIWNKDAIGSGATHVLRRM